MVRNYSEAPPSYTTNTPGTPRSPPPRPEDWSPHRRPSIIGSSDPRTQTGGLYPFLDTDSMIHSSPVVNERSSLLSSANANMPEYQTVPQRPRHKKHISASSIIIITFLITSIVNTIFFLMIRELGPLSRERIRREWGKEIQRHEAVRATWVVEAREHEKQRSAMVVERRSWQVEREEKRRELNELQQKIEEDQHNWEIRKQDRQREWDEQKVDHEKEVEKRRQRENEELSEQDRKLRELHQIIERDRSDWEVEKQDREREWKKRQQDYEKKMDERRRKKDAERRKREEDERERAGIHWEDLLPSQRCLGYGKREYTAKLVGIPDGQQKLSVCRQTEAEIHKEWIKPGSCEDRGSDGLWAKWTVDFQEPTCTTWWSNLIDKGCTAPGSHLRRYEQHLENIQGGDDWKVMCTTAPTDFHDHHFDAPTSCANWGSHGIYGYWDVSDSSC